MHKDGRWARQLIALQKEDGSWGQFHSMSKFSDRPVTTEQALTRLQRLGCTMEDECIRRAVAYMDDCLNGRNQIPDPREKLHDWDLFTSLMLSTRIRMFTQDNPSANQVAERWAKVITHAFSAGEYDHERYIEAYRETFVLKPKGGRLVDFGNFYPLTLLPGCLDERTENAVVDYVLHKDGGIYYICEKRLSDLPAFTDRKVSNYLAAIELLAAYKSARGQLKFVADWLNENRNENGRWDMGSAAKDGVYFPLSDDWRRKETREADCTERVTNLLERLFEN